LEAKIDFFVFPLLETCIDLLINSYKDEKEPASDVLLESYPFEQIYAICSLPLAVIISSLFTTNLLSKSSFSNSSSNFFNSFLMRYII
jgi:hypothetical protein